MGIRRSAHDLLAASAAAEGRLRPCSSGVLYYSQLQGGNASQEEDGGAMASALRTVLATHSAILRGPGPAAAPCCCRIALGTRRS